MKVLSLIISIGALTLSYFLWLDLKQSRAEAHESLICERTNHAEFIKLKTDLWDLEKANVEIPLFHQLDEKLTKVFAHVGILLTQHESQIEELIKEQHEHQDTRNPKR